MFFLKECIKWNLIPQHLRIFHNNNFLFFNTRSIRAFDGVVLRTIRSTLKIDYGFTYLWALQYNLFLYARFLYSGIPFSILNNFFRRQSVFFKYIFNKENHRITNKLQWLSGNRKIPIQSLQPVNYFCNIPPYPPVNKFKSKLRSYDFPPPSSLPPPIFFFHRFHIHPHSPHIIFS